MKRYFLNIVTLVLSVLLCNGVFAQINSGNGKVKFGSNTQYNYGIMPTNLPSGGEFGASQKAANAYNAWKSAYVESCGSGKYRVKFDDGYSTVSEGIAYGMLLSVYADDKSLFDGLWAYYQANMNGNGVMNWKINGCSGVSGSNGATDAELDVAMALIIASEQWPSGNYAATAKSFIKTIKNTEMNNDGQTLNGDAWGNMNSCRNPSYFAPAYYKEFAKVDTDNGTFWGTTAINASNTVLKANRNGTSGLVSNWCDNSGTENSCGNTGSGANGYGADACRNPWRMAVDYLWHGDDASSAAKDINAKLVSFVSGHENEMKGPFSNRNVSNPSSGSYVNGSYSTFALPPMTSSSAQSSLNKCYNAVANLTDVDAYFNSTIRCITLFVLTGNFWAPGASGFVFPPSVSSAKTNSEGDEITLNMTKTMSAGSASGSKFTVYYNGIAQSGAVANVSVNSDKTIVLRLSTAPQPGQSISLSYDGSGNIKSSEGATLEAFTKIDVLNLLAGSETIVDDVDDKNEFNNVGGIWFSFDDSGNCNDSKSHGCGNPTKSTITPLSGNGTPFAVSKTGYDGTGYCIWANFKLGSGYVPMNGGSCASWTNPAFVGIGTYMHKDNVSVVDWSNGTGVTFWYKGPACSFQVVTTDVTDGGYHFWSIDACNTWTEVTRLFTELDQPTSWCQKVTFNPKHVQKLQWQWATDVTGANASGDIYIDEVHVLGMPPVELTGLTISPVSDDDLSDDHCHANIDPLKVPIGSGVAGDTLYLETTPTPPTATYPVVFWSSSDEDVVTVDYRGRVVGVGYGEATITARSKMHQNISATYTVKVPAPKKNPESISFEESSYEVTVGETTTIIPSFSPNGVTETGLTWTSSDNTKATVSSSGVVTGVAVGEVTITATSTAEGCSNVKKSVQVTVNPVAVTAISVNPESVTMEVGGSETVTATITPQSVSQAVTAESSNTDVVTVTVNNNEIIISSVDEGTATVTVKSVVDPTFTTSISVKVNPIAITGVAISGSETEILVGGTTTLTAAVTPANAAQTVTWTSSDENIATVTGGIVTGVAVGTVTITATSTKDNTKSDTYSIEVKPIKVTGITVAPATQSLSVG
ncbi:MAG: Ig-like domain-containing protein [Bacteroidales bacterium]|nr:Ig-like domain-containing protein [Bacteroidales bacterium]